MEPEVFERPTNVLAWGLQPPGGATVAWGARAIYSLRSVEDRFFKNGKRRKNPVSKTVAQVELLWDRQSAFGNAEELNALNAWLNAKGLPELRARCVKEYLTPDSEDEIELMHEDPLSGMPLYALKASPRASYGYLYICAWKVVPS